MPPNLLRARRLRGGLHVGRRLPATAIQRAWTSNITRLVREAQAAGSLPVDDDPAQVAFELDAYGMMGNVGFVLHDEPAYLNHARAAIHRRLAGD